MFKQLKSYFSLFLFLSLSFAIHAQKNEIDALSEKIEAYKEKFKVSSIYESITDNHGDNCPLVYGTRNMRVVLHGIVYRGGANNVYNKNLVRDNKNPMPEEGLENLLKVGFSTSVYLYQKNFSDVNKIIGPDSNGRTLKYIQNSLSNDKEIRELLELVYRNILDPASGPIYLHCWNGWHQSGYASALILMQFCGFTNEEAYRYWEKCAAGNLTKYRHIKKAIFEFKPYKEYKLPSEIKKMICPG
jgi:hypothetical protein